jgi:NAD(P)-dependent dehydrogenase (short-subunit alcohol dehydrogenase family)
MTNEHLRAVVTGGAGGIGLAIVRAPHGAWMMVAIGDLNALERWEVGRDRLFPLPFDIRNRGSVKMAFGGAWSHMGGVDVLVNCAGGGPLSPLFDITEDEWDQVVDTNLKGTSLCSQEFSRRLARAGTGGVIVNISSTASGVARPNIAAYGPAKAGINSLRRFWQLSWRLFRSG